MSAPHSSGVFEKRGMLSIAFVATSLRECLPHNLLQGLPSFGLFSSLGGECRVNCGVDGPAPFGGSKPAKPAQPAHDLLGILGRFPAHLADAAPNIAYR